MQFPETNKPFEDEPVDKSFGNTAKALEEIAKKIDWIYMLKVWSSLLLITCVSIFTLIVSVLGAVNLF
jgi:hypothetical protein